MRRDANDVGRVAAAGSLCVIRMDRAAGDCGDRSFEKSRFVDGVGVNRHLHVVLVGDLKTRIYGGRRSAPIFVQFQAARSRFNLFGERSARRGIPFTEKAEIHRPRLGGFEHPRQIPRARRTGSGRCARGWSRASAYHRRNAVRHRFVNLLRRNEVDVAVHTSRSDNQILAGNYFRRCANHQLAVNSSHRVRITGLANFDDTAVLHADVALHDSPVIQNHSVRDDQIKRGFSACPHGRAALTHAVADHFSAAKRHFVSENGEVLFDFDEKFGVAQANTVSARRAVQVRVSSTRNSETHQSFSRSN